MSNYGTVEDFLISLNGAYNKSVDMYWSMQILQAKLYGSNHPNTIDAIRDVLDDVYYVLRNLFQWEGGGQHTIFANWVKNIGDGAPEIDMAAILNAMENAEPHQPILFIAYEEAFKASIWDATFDENFFAELVRKWKIWE